MEFEIADIPKNSAEATYNLKVVIVGDSGVGKSNIINRYCNDQFSQDGKATVGVELEHKFFKVQKEVLNVIIWDTAGQERFKSITNAYYRGAHGVIVVFDLTRRDSFENCRNWFNEVKNTNSQILNNMLLVGNKSDLNELRQINSEEGKEMAASLNVAYFETSALDNKDKNINKAFLKLVENIYRENILNKINAMKESENIKLDKSDNIALDVSAKQEKKKCC